MNLAIEPNRVAHISLSSSSLCPTTYAKRYLTNHFNFDVALRAFPFERICVQLITVADSFLKAIRKRVRTLILSRNPHFTSLPIHFNWLSRFSAVLASTACLMLHAYSMKINFHQVFSSSSTKYHLACARDAFNA